MPQKLIDLRKLAKTEVGTIERMKGAVERCSGGLWTAEIRPTTRGGKCWVTSAEDSKEERGK